MIKLRNDSPFVGLSEEEVIRLRVVYERHGVQGALRVLAAREPAVRCSPDALKKFLGRLREAELAEELAESEASAAAIAAKGEGSKARDAAITLSRNQLYQEVVAGRGTEVTLEVFAAMNKEKLQEKRLAMEERKLRLMEERAKLDREKLEAMRAVAAAKLLPKVWAILNEGKLAAEERLAKARRCLAAVAEKKLIGEGEATVVEVVSSGGAEKGGGGN